MEKNLANTVYALFSGSKVALSRLLTLVEKQPAVIPEIMKSFASRIGKAHCIGITGAAGSGKSSLINQLVAVMRNKGLSVGILAVDPSSTLTGGALLGDRIRMQQHYLDEGVFIRSQATRGSMGGLSRSALAFVNTLDAFGKDLILVETIGTGQTDIEIRHVADTVIAIFTPESGDVIQFMKGGIIEIADIVVVNEYNSLESYNTASELKEILALRQSDQDWKIPVQIVNARSGVGINQLYEQIESHRRFLDSIGWPVRKIRLNQCLNSSNDSKN